MIIYTRKDTINKKREIIRKIQDGAVFIYPTDTIYGIGCDATNTMSVKRVREIKERDKKPISIIAPGFEWIRKNCKITSLVKKWIMKLPGAYTLVLFLKNNKAVCIETNNGLNSIGVRVPAHWISAFFEMVGLPIVTTSVNKAGKEPSTTLEQLKKFDVDFIIYDGELRGKPSVVIDLKRVEKQLR